VNVDAFKFLAPRLWPDVFEILLVSFVIYRFLLFLVGTRALQIVVGLVILSLAYFVAVFAKFNDDQLAAGRRLHLRRVRGGRGVPARAAQCPRPARAVAFMRVFSRGDRQSVAEEIAEGSTGCRAPGPARSSPSKATSDSRSFITTGVPMEAKVSADLLTTIFTPYSPLHDGAVLIRGDQIIGAGCACPATCRPTLKLR